MSSGKSDALNPRIPAEDIRNLAVADANVLANSNGLLPVGNRKISIIGLGASSGGWALKGELFVLPTQPILATMPIGNGSLEHGGELQEGEEEKVERVAQEEPARQRCSEQDLAERSKTDRLGFRA